MKAFVLLVVLVLSIQAGFAQYPVILSQDATTLGKGVVEAALGIEYFEKHRAPSAGLPLAETRLCVAAFHCGVAENVDFDLDWRGGLFAELENGARHFDWGDLSVSTRILLLREGRARPAIGIRSAVKLPNTSFHPVRLGTNETDYSICLLLTKHFSQVETRLNAAFTILGDPLSKDSQNDVYAFSAAGIAHVESWLRFFLEWHGFTGYKEDDDKLVVRAGTSLSFAGVEWHAFGSVRVLGNNRDFGTAFDSSQNWSVGLMFMKYVQLDL